MKTVITYLKGIPNTKNPEKVDVLNKFAQGVTVSGDNGIASMQSTWTQSDVGVIQGYVHSDSPNSTHLKLRRSVLDNQKNSGKHTIIIDSNLFLYATPGNPHHYLRYSLDGVFPTTGNYFWDDPDPSRWQSISKTLNIKLKPYTNKGKYILICLQRNGGWSMGGLDVMQWCHQTIQTLTKHTDRPIVVRAHPGDKKARNYLRLNYPNVKITSATSILDDFQKAWAVVTYNSSPAVAAAIEGLPIFVTDPRPKKSQAYDVANTDLSQIENPMQFDRQQWIEKISMSHWNFQELTDGSAWKHMRKYI